MDSDPGSFRKFFGLAGSIPHKSYGLKSLKGVI